MDNLDNKKYGNNELLLKEYRETDNNEILDILIKDNLGLIHSVVNKYKKHFTHRLDRDDLIQAAMGGFLRAVKKYDFDQGVKFSTYAIPWLHQGISRTIHNEGFLIRIPVATFEQLNRLRDYIRDKDLRNEDIDENKLCEELGLSHNRYTELKGIKENKMHPMYLSQKVIFNDEYSELQDILGCEIEGYNIKTPEQLLILKEDKDYIKKLLSKLKLREQYVLEQRYSLKDEDIKTLEALGKELGLTKNGVRQIELKALKKLYNLINFK